jgi:uncharacterized repeat protein (TIGR03803 family)
MGSIRLSNSTTAIVAVVAVVAILIGTASAGSTVNVLYSFAGGVDGGYPETELLQDSLGNLYGTSVQGGLYGAGTVFQLTPAGVHHIIYNFTGGPDGGKPYHGVVFDAQGNLIGTASTGGGGPCAGGCGVVYKLTKSGNTFAFEVIYTFTGGSDGSDPVSPLLARGSPGTGFYGITISGGALGVGVIYKLEQDSSGKWHYRVIHTFTGVLDGVGDSANLLVDHSCIFGVSPVGGVNAKGNIFELCPTPVGEWNFGTIYSFQGFADGESPYGGLALYEDSVLYGTTYAGGAYGFGTIYELRVPENVEKVIYNFRGGSDGANPMSTLAVDGIGNLYGTNTTLGDPTCSCGTIFKLRHNNKGGWNESVLYRFPGAPGPGFAYSSLGAVFYGATVNGGTTNNGAIYKLTP